MPPSADLIAALYGLGASATWGAADFCGGLAARRASVFGVVLGAPPVGVLALLALALGSGEALPGRADLLWGLGAGAAGSVGLAALYRALSIGQMGVVAPTVALISGVIPVLVGVALEGLPRPLQIAGFALALVAIVLIARPQGVDGPPRGLGMAALSGLGISGFYILLDRIGEGALFWPLAASRLSSLSVMALAVLISRQRAVPARSVLLPVSLAGGLDVIGNVCFKLAVQIGRLDSGTVLSSLYPVTTLLLARLILDERIRGLQAIGAALALAAIVLIAL